MVGPSATRYSHKTGPPRNRLPLEATFPRQIPFPVIRFSLPFPLTVLCLNRRVLSVGAGPGRSQPIHGNDHR